MTGQLTELSTPELAARVLCTADLSGINESDLYEILNRVQEEIERRNNDTFLPSLREALEELDQVRGLIQEHGAVDLVTFSTEHYENGYFFYSRASVRFADGSVEEVDLEYFDEVLTEQRYNYRDEIGSYSKLFVSLTHGKFEFNPYGNEPGWA